MVKLLLLVCIIASMATAVAGASAKPTSLRFKSQANTATGGCLSEGKAQADGKCQCETKRDEWKANPTSAATTVNFCKCCYFNSYTIKWVKNSCADVAKNKECALETKAGFPVPQTEEAKKKLHNACHAERHAPECAYPKCAGHSQEWMHDSKAACKACAIRLEKCCDGGKKLEKYERTTSKLGERSEASKKSLWRYFANKVVIDGQVVMASPNCDETDKAEYLRVV